jgi:hypothetical protein
VLLDNTTGSGNVGVGAQALLSNKTGSNDVAAGINSLYDSTASNNAALGSSALYHDITGASNVAIGSSAGTNLTTGSNNIEISNAGIAGDTGQIHIGTQGVQQAAFIAGVNATTIPGASLPVVVNSNGQLGTASSGAPAESSRLVESAPMATAERWRPEKRCVSRWSAPRRLGSLA